MSDRLEEIKEKTRRWYSAYEYKMRTPSFKIGDFEWLIAEVERLRAELSGLKLEAEKDYHSMRDMQLKYIDADHKRIKAEGKLAVAEKRIEEAELLIDEVQCQCPDENPWLKRALKWLEGKP